MKHFTSGTRMTIFLALSLILLLTAAQSKAQDIPGSPLQPGPNDTAAHNLSDSLTTSVTAMQPTDTCNGWIYIDVSGGKRFGTFPPYHVYLLPNPYFINPIPPSFLNDSLYVIGPVCPGTYYFVTIDSSGTQRRDSVVLVRRSAPSDSIVYPWSFVVHSATLLQQPQDQLYPNPFTDYASVRFNNSSDGNITVIIYNGAGKMEQRTVIKGKKGENIYVLDGKTLNKGIHFVKIIMPCRSIVMKALRL